MEMTVRDIFLKAGEAVLADDFDTALSIYNQFIEQGGDNFFIDDAMYNVGLIYFLKKDYDNAIEVFRKIITEYPDSKIDSVSTAKEVGHTAAKAYLGIGNSYAAKQEYDKAIPEYLKVSDYPDSYTVVKTDDNDKKREYFAAIALDKVINIYENVLKDADKAAEYREKLRNRFPGSIFLK